MNSEDKFVLVTLTVVFLAVLASITAMTITDTRVVVARGSQLSYAAPHAQPVVSVIESPQKIVVPEEMPEELKVEPEPSLAEQYLAEFNEKVRSYSFKVRCDVHGPLKMKVNVKTGDVRYQSQSQLFVLNEETNTVEKSHFSNELSSKCRDDSSTWNPLTKDFMKDLEKRKTNEMNTIWWDEAAQTYTGCFVDSRHVDLDHCVRDNSTERVSIIHTGFAFERPNTPQQVLEQFVGREPAYVLENRGYTIRDSTQVVNANHAVYNNEDGTETVLYVHSYYKGLLQMDVIDDEVVTYSIVYDAIEFQG